MKSKMKPYKFPYKEISGLHNYTNDCRYLISELNQAVTYISNLEYELVDLKRDIKRLEEENRFLTSLISKYEDD